MRWLLLAALWAVVVSALLDTTQGAYEDHALVAQASTEWLSPRGLLRASVWWQAQAGWSPRAARALNLGLATAVSLSVGGLAWQLGLPAWIAAGTMALHPLAVETYATLSGRGELLAALGVMLACVVATRPWRPLELMLMAACLTLGIWGKESAIVGLMLLPLVGWASGRRTGWLVWVGVLVVAGVAWDARNLGEDPVAAIGGGTWLVRQSGAAWRLLLLSILPIGQTVDYDVDRLSRIWCVMGLGGFAGLAGLLWWARDHRRLVLGGAWVLAVILPRLIVQTPRSYLNEHQWYLALAGLALGLAAVCGEYGVFRSAHTRV